MNSNSQITGWMRFTAWAVLLSLAGVPAPAKKQFEKTDLIDRVLEVTGATKQIEQIEPMVESQLVFVLMMAPDKAATIKKSIRRAFDSKRMQKFFVDALRTHFKRAALESVMSWYGSALAQRITQAEIDSGTPEAMKEFEVFQGRMASNPPSKERLNLAKELDHAAGLSETRLEMAVSIMRGMLKSIGPIMPQDRRMTEPDLQAMIATLKSSEASIRKSTETMILFTYRETSRADLREYINFYESPDGAWFQKRISRAMIEALGHSMEIFSEGLAEMLRK